MCVCVCGYVHACTCVCVSMRRCVWMETILQRTIASLDSKHCNCPISGWQSSEIAKSSPLCHTTLTHRCIDCNSQESDCVRCKVELRPNCLHHTALDCRMWGGPKRREETALLSSSCVCKTNTMEYILIKTCNYAYNKKKLQDRVQGVHGI